MPRRRASEEHREAERQFELQKAQAELLGLIGQLKDLFGREIRFDEQGRVMSKIRTSDVGDGEWSVVSNLISEIRKRVDKGAKIPVENLGNEDVCQNPVGVNDR
ncbi:hypothetical protein HZC21_01730 [Candidatus Peregrinibacteria bacterium]|nr:hypothetical protein [Candidatus Peregrinibacteria bacterium]